MKNDNLNFYSTILVASCKFGIVKFLLNELTNFKKSYAYSY